MINTTDFEELARRITGQINSIRTLKTDILLKHIQFGTSVNRDKSLEDMEKHLDKMLDHVELDFVKLYRYVGLLTSTIEKSQLCDLGDEDLERLSALQEYVELLDIEKSKKIKLMSDLHELMLDLARIRERQVQFDDDELRSIYEGSDEIFNK